MSSLDTYRSHLSRGDFADIYLEDSAALSLRWEDGRLEAASSSRDTGAGLRFLNGAETRFGHTTLARPLDGALDGAEQARLCELAGGLGEGFPALVPAAAAAADLHEHPVGLMPDGVRFDDKVALLKRVFEAASRPGVRQVSINYGEKIKTTAYLNSLGEARRERRVYMVFSVTVTAAEGGLIQNAYDSLGGLGGFEMFASGAPERIAAQVAERAILKLKAPEAPVGEMPVVIASSAGGTLIHEAIGHSLEADAVLEGTSPAYIGRIGQVVANPKLTVYDNPTVPGARGSFHFDDEGTPSEATRLIENGVLKDYLYDRVSARRAGRVSNGHGRRESYAHRPIPRMSNTYVAPGPDSAAEILSGFRDGLLVTKMGGGQVNPANGDFVFEVEEGFRVEGGRRTLVRGCTLLGNGPAVLLSIDKVGSDHGWAIGTCGKEGQGVPVSDALPTVHIPRLVVGGLG